MMLARQFTAATVRGQNLLSATTRPPAAATCVRALSAAGVSPPPPPPPTSSYSATSSTDAGANAAQSKVVVFGGSGFVGSNVCQAALKLGAKVVSINRSGAPVGKKWAEDVRWVRGDIFQPDNYASELVGAVGAVSCVGAFGSNEHMEKICGDATVVATEAAEKAGVEHFVFVSAAGSQHTHFFLKGYWKGKQKAEEAVMQRFPVGGVILRAPGIYGSRDVGPVTLPMGLLMQPVEMLLSTSPFSSLRKIGPLEPILTPPVSVENVAKVAAGGALGTVPPGVLLVDDINHFSKGI